MKKNYVMRNAPPLTGTEGENYESISDLGRYKQARTAAEQAIKEKKIFAIHGYYPVIRASLRRRGWAERKFAFLPSYNLNTNFNECDENGGGVGNGDSSPQFQKNELFFYNCDQSDDFHDQLSRLVRKEIPYLMWTSRRDVIDHHFLTKEQIINHYGKTSSFTTKVGLCLSLKNLSWYEEANPDSFFPRCYRPGAEDERHAFIEDFRLTAATSILKWVVEFNTCDTDSTNTTEHTASKSTREEDQDSEKPNRKTASYLSTELINIACRVCENHLSSLEHDDIDAAMNTPPLLSEAEWEDVIQQYYWLIHDAAVIAYSFGYITQCQNILNRLKSVSPQLDIDGIRNIWIVKPGAQSRGRGIMCMDRLEEILKVVRNDVFVGKESKWVVQKYIERPLLIYDTKFDIRQWFLITDWSPLTIWFYKECYLRFSTQPFSLENLDSSIHLCNNSIQKQYKNSSERNTLVPIENMWSCTEFQEYLEKRGFGHVWQDIVCSTMKQAIIYTMRTVQDNVEARKSSFELYGADFLLGEDFKPWLIEINSSPTMSPSTSVTAGLCAHVQEDTIKVVIDRKYDKSCDTGKFELLYKQGTVDVPPYHGTNLLVEGCSIRKAKTQSGVMSNMSLASYATRLSKLLHVRPEFSSADKEKQTQEAKAKRRKQTAEEKSLSSRYAPKTAPERASRIQTRRTSGGRLDRSTLSTFIFHHANIVPKIKHIDLTSKASTATHAKLLNRSAITVPNTEVMDWTPLKPSNLSGLHTVAKIPCLICRNTFQLERTCKHCNSFSAKVLQGGPVAAIPPAPDKKSKCRLLTAASNGLLL